MKPCRDATHRVSTTNQTTTMKTSDAFKNTIQSYLEGRAATDELFAISFAKEDKTIDNCINYILTTVQKSGCNGFTDDEVFGMAVHYYDEDQIEVGTPVNGRLGRHCTNLNIKT